MVVFLSIHPVVDGQAAKITVSCGAGGGEDMPGCGGKVGHPLLLPAGGGTTTQLKTVVGDL